MIAQNLSYLRKLNGYSQEDVADKIGVSRQAVAKWESGDTLPDLENSLALSQLYNVTLDNLVGYDAEKEKLPIASKGKHAFGCVTVGERGQIVLPKKARDIFHICAGDRLLILGDEAQGGIAIIKESDFLAAMDFILGKEGGQHE